MFYPARSILKRKLSRKLVKLILGLKSRQKIRMSSISNELKEHNIQRNILFEWYISIKTTQKHYPRAEKCFK